MLRRELVPYESTKARFEQTVFFCEEDAMVYEIIHSPDDYELRARTYQAFSIVYRPIKYSKFDEHHSLKKFRFINKWIKDPNRRRYARLTFAPPPLIPRDDEFNRWLGFYIEQYPIPPAEDTVACEGCQLLIRHIRLMTNNDEILFRYMWLWFADMVKFPGKQSRIMFVLHSNAQQIGKSLLYSIFENLFGKSLAISIDNPNSIFGKFNSIISDKLLICLEEFGILLSRADETRSHMDILHETEGFANRMRYLITRRGLTVREKNRSQYDMPNYSRYLMCTSSMRAQSLPVDERIFAIPVHCQRQADSYYFAVAAAAKNIQALRLLFEMLKNEPEATEDLDLVAIRPNTDTEEEELGEASTPSAELEEEYEAREPIPPEIRFFCNFIREQYARNQGNIRFLITHQDLYAKYTEQAAANGTHIISSIQMSKSIRSLMNDAPETECGIRSFISSGYRKYDINLPLAINWLTEKGLIEHR
ncbi:primase-helicase family protein [Methylomonas sp.]|uniref:primase-helicase family protein n=1 Tax=Methylomonas sp. TaxID=418 RepID=UPI0025E777C3|nr:primase-helicase family protein [Methylomonas sp.]